MSASILFPNLECPTPVPLSRSLHPTLVLIGIAALSGGITMRVIEPMLPRLAEEFGSSVAALAVVITTFAFAQTVAQYFHGPLGDRFGKLRIVTAIVALAAFASLGTATAQDLNTMAVWRFATGFLVSGTMTLGMAYLADVIPMEQRQPILARFVSGAIAGQSAGPFVGGALTDAFGWRSTFFVLSAVFAVVAATLYARTRREWPPIAPAKGALFSPRQHLAVLARPRARRVLLTVGFEMMCLYGAFAYLGVLLREKFDLSYTLIGALLAGFGVGGLLYIALVRVVLGALGQRGCVLVGGLLSAMFLIGAVLVPWWQAVGVCTLGLGFAFYTMHNTIQTKATEMAPDIRTTAVAMFSMGWSGGQAIGVALMGAAIGTVGYVPMVVLFALGLAGLGITLRYKLDRL